MKSARDIRTIMQEAMALHQQGQLGRAESMYREVLSLQPQESNAWHLLGVAAWQRGDLKTAETNIRKAIGFLDSAPAYHCNLGGVLKQKGDFPGAITVYRDALRVLPDYPDAKKGLAESYGKHGHALSVAHRWDEAKAAYRALLEINPNDAGALNNLAQILHNGGEANEALKLYDRAIALRPDYLIARFNRAICRLGQNRLADGWDDLAASTGDWIPRMNKSKDAPSQRWPLWNGEDVRGKKILVWGDQGVGDEILYAGMVPELVAKGAQITIECDARLVPLFKRSFGEATVVPRRIPLAPVGHIDFHAPGLWLGRFLRPAFDSFPPAMPYLTADAKMAEMLRARYAKHGKKKIVGLSWHSKTAGYGEHRRMELRELAAALPYEDVLYIDLQYGDTSEEREAVQRELPGFTLHHDPLIDQMRDLDGFAAQIAACDMVVTIGNTTAHMAGALGVPAAVFLPVAGLTWYWFADMEKSPWYGSLHLLRKEKDGGWAAARAEAAKKVAGSPQRPMPEIDDETARKRLSEVLHRRGMQFMADRHLEDAKTAYRQVLEIDPDNVATLNNLAMIIQHEGDRAAARELYGRALHIAPDKLVTRYNRAICSLTEGRLEEGWADLAASTPHWLPMQDERKNLPWLSGPLWNGEDLRGRKILVWGDPGIGDEVVYISMIPDLLARGAQVTIECKDRLVPLVTRAFPEVVAIPRQDPPLPRSDFDFHAPNLWLGHFLRPDMPSFPHRHSFLKADAAKTARLRQRYEGLGKKCIIGVAWYTASWPWGLKRSIPLPDILGVIPLDDALIVDLQYGDTADAWNEARRVFPELTAIHDNDVDQFKDMDIYAAQIAACDFIVTISNTTPHIAGALGVPACVLMPDEGLTWYWFENGEECPWYPSLTLLRPSVTDRLERAGRMASGAADS